MNRDADGPKPSAAARALRAARQSCSGLTLTLLLVSTPVFAQAPISYEVTFPDAAHHLADVSVTFPELGQAALRARMSRSSPGRYAVHEFAKNVSEVHAFDGAGRALVLSRPEPDEWRVGGHDGTVRLVYRVFGDFPDGTYMGVDPTHAHLNMPAAFMWAMGLETRAIRVRFVPPPDAGWTAATQLFATSDPLVFTAPNLQYFMDSPVELAHLVTSTFDVPDGSRSVRFRVMVHGDSRQADVDRLAAAAARLVRVERDVFGTFPSYEPGSYTFILDLVPWAEIDAMEHRNSTYVSAPGAALETEGGQRRVLDMMAHEFFHTWNVERIRPAGLEPFDFTRENITCCLWLAEGFTEYYGPLLLRRAGLVPQLSMSDVVQVINGSGRRVRSAVEMSEAAPFADAAVANDADDRSRTFISYYTYGSALALGLDLSIREASRGARSLDDYMARLWRDFGAPPAPAPGLVARPYTLDDLRAALADVVGNRAFADEFFARYIEGRDVPDYGRLLDLAGYMLRPVAPQTGWPGAVVIEQEARGLRVGGSDGRGALVPYGTPAYDAGLDSGDLLLTIDGQPATSAVWASLGRRAVGDRVRLSIERRDGRRVDTTMTLAANPALQIVGIDALGRPLTPAQTTFRNAWFAAPPR